MNKTKEIDRESLSEIKEINREILDRKNKSRWKYKIKPGINEEVVRKISEYKKEPEWMLQHRLKCYEIFKQLKMPEWGPNLKKLNLDEITYFGIPDANRANKWEDVPQDIKETFERLGIPEAERRSLAGAGTQYESAVVYHNLKKEWEEQGVVFEDCDIALKEYPDLMKKYFMKCVPPALHKFAALHGAVWSGGTFIYVPKNVKVKMPLQAYFRMNEAGMGQFEHTLIIAEEGAEVIYIEGCSAPKYSKNSLHAGCVELFVHKNARMRYNSIENWSRNTYNLNTKRAIVEENGVIEWINGNMGSYITMLYPSSILKGKNAKSDFLGIAFANKGQNQDTGCKVYHLAPNTSSTIQSKSISKDGGIVTYRGLVIVAKNAINSKVNVQCDALMTDNKSKSNTIPYMDIRNSKVAIEHEASVSRISEEQLFYLMSRGLNKEQARQMIVSGFIEPIVKALPIEYAVELNRLIEMEMEGSLG